MILLLSLFELSDSVVDRFVKLDSSHLDYLLGSRPDRYAPLRELGGWHNRDLVKVMVIYRLFSIGPYTKWEYRNNSYVGRQYYLPQMVRRLGRPAEYDCDEIAHLLVRAFRDNGYEAYLYVPFSVHMTVIVRIGGRWVEIDGSGIEMPPVKVLEREPYFVILGDSVGYYDEETYRTQLKIDARYVKRVIPLLYRKAMGRVPGGRRRVLRYLREVLGG